MTPISKEQTTLIKFFPRLQKRIGRRGIVFSRKNSAQPRYNLLLESSNELKIKETHCLKCGTRLVKNGWNPRILIIDGIRGKKKIRMIRKRCVNCGEIKPDLSRFVPTNGIYHERFKRMARQHYMEGLMPPQIQRVFEIDFGVRVSKTSIVNWINEAAEPLRKMLKETPVPSSGYWGYDEIHMKIAGKKRYTIDTVDLNTKFIPVARITENMGREIGREILAEGRTHATLKLKGLIKDCSTNLGGLFKTHKFKNVKLQNCKTHVKWIIHRHVKVFSGLSHGSTKPIPKEWRWLLRLFYNVIDSKNETSIYINLEILRGAIKQLSEKRFKRLVKAFKQLEKWTPKLIAHQSDPFLRSTNNLLESFHKKYTYYPTFKKHMMTERGAQRVLDYRVFRHNFGRFPKYIKHYELKRECWRASLSEMKGDYLFQGQARHYSSTIKTLNKWYEEYLKVWQQYFAIS